MGRDRIRQDGFVFWKGLLGEEGARKIQVAPRPPLVDAEAPDVADDGGDLVQGQGVTERRHAPRQTAYPSALVDHGHPVNVRFGGRKGTIGEVRQWRVEADARSRRASSVRTVTGDACRLINVLA